MMRYASNTLLDSLSERQISHLQRLLPIIQPALIVGGAVRNAILGLDLKDIDIATGLHPNDVKKRAMNAGMKVIDTGIEHGTVTVIIDYEAYEVTTLRKDVKTYGRKAEVEFLYTDTSYQNALDLFQIDASRRDFTINAMYSDLEGNIFDFFNGMHDLHAGVVKFIGDPKLRIQEDYLRILRFFRFACYYAHNLDQPSLDACYELCNGLKHISAERWTMEINKILQHPLSWAIIKRMLPVLRSIAITIPDADNTMQKVQNSEAKYDFHTNHIGKLAMFDEINLLTLSSQEKRQVIAIKNVPILQTREDIAKWAIQSVNEIHFWNGIVIKGCDANIEIDDIRSIFHKSREFSITGTQLIALGFTPGPELGVMLYKLKIRYCLDSISQDKILHDVILT